ncbi:hypothetical protein SAMN05216601_105149 [Ectopseudomonas composti]|uniref:Uncharacterized protein n=1 Tax=Ectopseudomonas composti TaxID=658457 RepID=A0A1I5MFN2_9GAMM|nr:hypothetical protein [Pseudomonas composti]SFP08107.1 hypothetical protein SAMN05216601_105149 [Pseudomonas composti]
MSKRLRTLLLMLGMLTSFCVCAESTPPLASDKSSYPEQVALAGQTYILESTRRACILRKPDQSVLTLDIPSPCHFSVGKDGQAHVETFKNVPIVMVLHVIPVADHKLECRSQYKAIRLIKGQLEPSVLAQSASCLRGVGDQKSYTAMFDW